MIIKSAATNHYYLTVTVTLKKKKKASVLRGILNSYKYCRTAQLPTRRLNHPEEIPTGYYQASVRFFVQLAGSRHCAAHNMERTCIPTHMHTYRDRGLV